MDVLVGKWMIHDEERERKVACSTERGGVGGCGGRERERRKAREKGKEKGYAYKFQLKLQMPCATCNSCIAIAICNL
jgi:hypothetical protein